MSSAPVNQFKNIILLLQVPYKVSIIIVTTSVW